MTPMIPSTLNAQFFRLRKTLLLALLLSLTVFLVIYGLSSHSGLPVRYLTNAAAQTGNTQFYIGILSKMDALIWISAAAICFFAASLQRRHAHGPAARFLFWSGILSLALTLDNLLLFHNRILPQHLHLSEKITYLVYALLVGYFLLYFTRDILATDYLLLILAMAFLCAAAMAKMFLSDEGVGIFFQDGFKFIGVVFWLSYFVHAAMDLTRPSDFSDPTRATPMVRP